MHHDASDATHSALFTVEVTQALSAKRATADDRAKRPILSVVFEEIRLNQQI
jgi:hypothetical protein